MKGSRVPSFDQRQRYGVLASLYDECVGASGGATLTVLDVGGFFRDFDGCPALPARELTGATAAVVLDREAWNRPESRDAFTPSGGYCRGDAGRLPFADGAFSLVSCLDVLEHVPRDRRAAVIQEISRVCSGWLLIAVPIADDGAPTRERRLAEFIAATGPSEHQQLSEHRRFGLPTHAEILAMLPDSTRSFAHGNLDRWLVMMLAKYYLLALPYNMPSFRHLDQAYARHAPDAERQGPFYRRFYLVRVGPGISDVPLERVAAVFEEIAPTDTDRTSVGDEMLSWLLKELVATDNARLEAARAPAVEENAALRQEIAALRIALEETRAVVRSVEGSRLYKLSRLIRRALPSSR